MEKNEFIEEAKRYFRKRVPGMTRKEAKMNALLCYENVKAEIKDFNIQDVYQTVDEELSYWPGDNFRGECMKESELQEELSKISSGMRLLDTIVNVNYETGEGKLNEKQVEVVRELLRLFRSLGWQLRFNNYKELRYRESEPIKTRRCGTPVKVRSCKKEHGEKTYFGILIGDVALSIGHSVDDDGVVTAERQMYNPAIFVPELNDIVYGCSSWWGEIESEKELKNMITEETVSDVWYVKLISHMHGEHS